MTLIGKWQPGFDFEVLGHCIQPPVDSENMISVEGFSEAHIYHFRVKESETQKRETFLFFFF